MADPNTPTIEQLQAALIEAFEKHEMACKAGDRERQLFFDGMISGIRCVANSARAKG